MAQVLQNILDDLEKNPPEDKNGGHEALMKDLMDLVLEAHEFEFNDFRNKKYGAPKVELRNKLLLLADNVVSGKYDN